MIYLDNAASTPLLPEVLEFYKGAIEEDFANPHADHALSHSCQQKLNKARVQVLKSLSAPLPETEVLWTSGGTEANNTALLCSALKAGDEVISSTFEHPSMINPLKVLEGRGVKVHLLPIDEEGQIRLDQLESLMNEKTRMVALTALQNELGSITDIKFVSKLIKDKYPKVLLHVDNVQGFGKLTLNWKRLQISSMSLAGHKFHGPNSCGALVYRKGFKFEALLVGGGQQGALRSGTVDAAAVSAFGLAAELNAERKKSEAKKIEALNELCREGLVKLLNKDGSAIDCQFFSMKQNSPYILMFALKGYEGSVLMRFLSTAGVYIGVGSACSAEVKEPNRTLLAMGADRQTAFAALRVSFAWQNTAEDVKAFLAELQKVLSNY